jgi:hypothetical protein
MAQRKRAVKKKAARKGARRGKGAAGRPELQITLAQFAKQVRTRLSRLEREIQSAEATKQLTRMLRDASHQLGKWEAAGEKRWKKLTANARRDALRLVKRIEKALSPAPAKPAAKPVAKPAAPGAPGGMAPRPAMPRPPTPAPMTTPAPISRPPMPTPSGMPPGRGEGQGGSSF